MNPEQFIKKFVNFLGLDIRRSWNTPVGDMKQFLIDINKRGFRSENIIDVGAYQCWFSNMAATIFPDANFYLFDPLLEVQPAMKKFCDQHNGSKYYGFALGSQTAEMELRTYENLSWSGLQESTNDPGSKRKVQVKKLNDLIDSQEIPIPDMIKIDVQGFELEVLKGGDSILGKTELILLEVSLANKPTEFPLLHEVIKFMGDHGYYAYDFPGFLRQQQDGTLIECDIAFVKKNSFLRNLH